jgi:tetratricopeptide (TPR) repeat protein
VGETDPALKEILRALVSDDGPTAKTGDLLGRYQLVRELGRGGFGVVFAARDTTLGRDVALKVMARRQDPDGRLREQFLREAASVAKLRHRNIVTVYDWGETAETPYLVLELLDGETLEARLGRGRLSLDEALDIAVHIAEGLAYAHKAGILHRDMKPSNVFLCADGVVRLLDFGLARETGGASVLGGAGTPQYMAPEQTNGGSTDARTDVYGLGLVLWELFTGKRPMPGEPRNLDDAEPAHLRPVLARCLAESPSGRFSDGTALLSALRGIDADRRERPRRLRRWLGAALVLGALSAVAAVVVMARRGDAERARTVAAIASGVDRVESDLRYAFLEPSHDTTFDVERARTKLAELARAAPSLRPIERGVVEVALGRGYLALGETTAAIEHLRAAERADPHADVAAPLAESLTDAWAEGERALTGSNATHRADELARLDRELRRPALELLKKSATPSPLDRARIAFLDGKLDDAVAEAHNAAGTADKCAAFRLGADILAAKVVHVFFQKGWSEPDMLAAESLSKDALAIGRSDPRLHAQACELATLRVDGRSKPNDAICDEAVRIAPARLANRLAAARYYMRRAVADVSRDETTRLYARAKEQLAAAKPLDADAAAIDGVRLGARVVTVQVMRGIKDDVELNALSAEAERLIAAHPDDSSLRSSLGELEFMRLHTDVDAGRDPTPRCERARALLTVAAEADTLSRLGRVELECSAWAATHNGDSAPGLRRAVDAYQRALKAQPSNGALWDELGGVYYERALGIRRGGDDAAADFREAIAAGEKAIALSRNSPRLNNLGMTYTEAAVNEVGLRRDPSQLFARAADLIEEAVTIDPSAPDLFYNLSLAYNERAAWLLDEKRDPGDALVKAAEAAHKAVALDPNNPALGGEVGDVSRQEARNAIRLNKSPLPAFARAAAQYDVLYKNDPRNLQVRYAYAELLRERAIWELWARRPEARATIERALAMLEPSDSLNNAMRFSRAKLWTLAAAERKEPGIAAAAFGQLMRMLGDGVRFGSITDYLVECTRLIAGVPRVAGNAPY